MRRYTLYEESLKIQVNNLSFQRCVLGFGHQDFSVSILVFSGPWPVLAYRLSVVFFCGSDCLGSAQTALFAEIQICDFAFLKANLLAESAFSLAW